MASNQMTQEEAFRWAKSVGYFPSFPVWAGHIGGWGVVARLSLAHYREQKAEWEQGQKAISPEPRGQAGREGK